MHGSGFLAAGDVISYTKQVLGRRAVLWLLPLLQTFAAGAFDVAVSIGGARAQSNLLRSPPACGARCTSGSRRRTPQGRALGSRCCCLARLTILLVCARFVFCCAALGVCALVLMLLRAARRSTDVAEVQQCRVAPGCYTCSVAPVVQGRREVLMILIACTVYV